MARGLRINPRSLGTPPAPEQNQFPPNRSDKESKRALSISRVVTEIIIRVAMGDPSERYAKVVADVIPANALITLSPRNRLNAGTSFPFAYNVGLVQEALACRTRWVEVSWLQEYDDRWTHSVRVCCETRIDPTDPLQMGRSAQFNFLYFFENSVPKLRTCLVLYEEESGSSSPVSLLCARPVVM